MAQDWFSQGTAPVTAAPARRGVLLRDPYREREEGRKEEDQQLQRQQMLLSERSASRQDATAERVAQNDAQSDARAGAKDRINNPQTLRQEYGKLPEIRAFRVAAQQAQASLNTAPNPQGDIALTYAFAKAMDPDSVVRNEEQGMVVNSQPWFQSAVQEIKKQFGMDGAGSFTPEARARLRQEVMRSIASRKPLYDARRAEMADYAKTYGIDPYEVVGKPDTDIYAPSFRSYAEKNGDEGGVIAGIIGGDPIKPAGGPPPAMPGVGPAPAAGYGATASSVRVPPQMQQEETAYLTKNWGKLDPSDYAAFRINLDRKYGFGSNPDAYAEAAPRLNEFAAKGGAPGQSPIEGVTKELSGLDQFRNNLLSDKAGVGAAIASGLNAGGLGIPSMLAPEQMAALRDANPISTTVGDIAGGVAGTGVAGGILRNVAGRMAPGAVATALANPLAGDLAYGATYGATQADNPLYGATSGVAAALVGNRAGRAIGRALPEATFSGGAIRAADETVPSSQQLRQQASRLYDAAEDTGERIGGDETFALNDRLSQVLAREGRLSPTGRLTEVQPRVREAFQLAGDYAGQPMAPRQVQTVRRVLGDAVTSPENDERRIARLLLNEFDAWTDAAAPEMAGTLGRARQVASRYLQGDEVNLARELAEVRAGQFSNAGQGNALRTDFRQLDRRIARGQESFTPPVEEAIANVARGTPVGNALRFAGRFAPTGPVSAIPMLLAVGGGQAAAGGAGAVGAIGAAGLAYGARQLGQRVTNRSAQVAENLAYGGPEYQALLGTALDQAADRGGHGGAAIGSEVARLLADRFAY